MANRVHQVNNEVTENADTESILFLAGSIEMGKAENWQTKVMKILENENILILNPRRQDWDSSWKQNIDNRQFRKQVEWELDGLDMADNILLYFDKNTNSPISLLELGLYAHTGKMIVCCPEGFWRKGNVDIVCRKYHIPQIKDLLEIIDYLSSQTKEEKKR